MNRVQRFYQSWYQPDVYMETEDWLYIGALGASWLISFGLGLLIGMIIAR